MPRVRNFIKSFPTDDRPTIELLLSSIQVVSLSQLQDDLMAALSEHIDKTNIPSKGFIVDPVIGTDDLQKWHKINLSKFKSGTLSKKVQDIRYYLHAEPSEIWL